MRWLHLAQTATDELESILSHLVRGASDEIPNITNQKKVDRQWVYWYRNKEDRETLSNFLGKTVLDSANLVYNGGSRQAPHFRSRFIRNSNNRWASYGSGS